MDTADDPELEAVAGMQRRRNLGIAAALVVLALGAGAAWAVLRPKPCDELVRDLCVGQPVAGCRELADRLEGIGVTQDECEGGLAALRGAPPSMRDSIKVSVIMTLMREHMDPALVDELERTARERAGAPPL